MKVQFQKINEEAQLPTKKTAGAACYDAYAVNEQSIAPGATGCVPLGFSVAVPEGYELQVRARSGLALQGIMVANGVGCVDSDYRGEVGVIIHNASQDHFTVLPGERICQLKLAAALDIEWDEAEALDATERGDGGFGSTGQ